MKLQHEKASRHSLNDARHPTSSASEDWICGSLFDCRKVRVATGETQQAYAELKRGNQKQAFGANEFVCVFDEAQGLCHRLRNE